MRAALAHDCDATASCPFACGVWQITDETLTHARGEINAAIQIHTGKSYSNTALAVVRYGWTCDTYPGRMTLSSGVMGSLTPDILSERLHAWERFFDALPLLFSGKKFGSTMVKLTAPMALAVAQYAQRAGITMANDFLEGFFGEKEVAADSPAHKALLLTLATFRYLPEHRCEPNRTKLP